jgi:hypothetical protein
MGSTPIVGSKRHLHRYSKFQEAADRSVLPLGGHILDEILCDCRESSAFHFQEAVMPDSVLRCKMVVERVTHVKNAEGETDREEVTLRAVYGKEGTPNAEWSKWTPNAQFAITISNPEAFNKLSSGHEFYVDFTPAEVSE